MKIFVLTTYYDFACGCAGGLTTPAEAPRAFRTRQGAEVAAQEVRERLLCSWVITELPLGD